MSQEPEANIEDREISVDEEALGLDDKETQDEKSEKEESSASQEEGQEEKSEDDSTSADSLKTEKEESEEKKENEEDEETRFDKHPRWQKLKQERDEALEQAKALKELKSVIGDTDSSDLKKLSEASALLKKYPELAKKVQKVIDEHTFESEEVSNKFNQIMQRQEALETKIIVDKLVAESERLISSAKLKANEEPLLREIFSSRVAKIQFKGDDGVSKLKGVFDKTLKDIETFKRENLASHIETKKSEKSVPSSPASRGKGLPGKKESAETEDVVAELAEGLRSMRLGTEKE